MNKAIVSPSILNCDYFHLESEVNKIVSAGASWLHFDVMDGHFVPNISIGNLFLEKIAPQISLVKDVHIMVRDPMKFVKKFAEAGAEYLTFHFETYRDYKKIKKTIDLIHENGMKVGLSIKPNTNVKKVFPFLDQLNLVLLMSVNPGQGGQSFIPETLEKITSLKTEIKKRNLSTLISVDGGINDQTAPQCIASGADVLVVGSYLFNSKDFEGNFKKLIK